MKTGLFLTLAMTLAASTSAIASDKALKCSSTCLVVRYDILIKRYEVSRAIPYQSDADTREEAATQIKNACLKQAYGMDALLVNSYQKLRVRMSGMVLPGAFLGDYTKTTINNMKCVSKGDQAIL